MRATFSPAFSGIYEKENVPSDKAGIVKEGKMEISALLQLVLSVTELGRGLYIVNV